MGIGVVVSAGSDPRSRDLMEGKKQGYSLSIAQILIPIRSFQVERGKRWNRGEELTTSRIQCDSSV